MEEEDEEDDGFDDDDDQLESEDLEYADDDDNFNKLMEKMPCGEEWLSSNFLATTNDALRQTQTIQSKIQESRKDLNRSVNSNLNLS